MLNNQAVSSWLPTLSSQVCSVLNTSLHPARKDTEQHFVSLQGPVGSHCRCVCVCVCARGLEQRGSLLVRGTGNYCLSKYLCECGMEMNFETEGVFIQQIFACFVSCLWKTCTMDEYLALKWNKCNLCSFYPLSFPSNCGNSKLLWLRKGYNVKHCFPQTNALRHDNLLEAHPWIVASCLPTGAYFASKDWKKGEDSLLNRMSLFNIQTKFLKDLQMSSCRFQTMLKNLKENKHSELAIQ